MAAEKARYAAFLAGLERGLSVTGAAAAANLPRGALYRWREDDPDFAAAWRMAALAGADLLEDEALRRAMEGVEKPVFYRGQQVGTVRVYNDRLLMWLLQRRQPAAQDLRQALEEADACRQEMTRELERARERIAQLGQELMEARQAPAGAILRDDVPPFADEPGPDAATMDEDVSDDDRGDAVPSATPADPPSPPVSKYPADASPTGQPARQSGGATVAAGGAFSSPESRRALLADLLSYTPPGATKANAAGIPAGASADARRGLP